MPTKLMNKAILISNARAMNSRWSFARGFKSIVDIANGM